MDRQEILENILAGEVFLSAGLKLAEYLTFSNPNHSEALGASLLACTIMGMATSYIITPKEMTYSEHKYIFDKMSI